MMSRILPLAAALTLASCSPSYPKQYESFEGKKVTVRFEDGSAVSGYLYSDGAVGYGRNSPMKDEVTLINWDKVTSVKLFKLR